MSFGDYYKIGHITNPIGFRGELLVNSFFIKRSHLSNLKFLYINIDETLIPFKIKKITLNNKNIRLKLEDVNNENDVSKLKEKSVYLSKKDLILEEKENKIERILDFEIIENNKIIGTVKDYYEKKIQPLIVTEIEQKEILIPYDNNIIKKIDYKKKKIFVELPKGLLEI